MKLTTLLILLFLSLNAKTYVLSSPDSSMQKVAQKILRIAYSRANLNIKVKYLQQEESLIASNTGETDGEIARIKTISKIYPNLVIVPIAIAHIKAVAFSLNKNIHISSWSDLSKYDFTIIKGIKFIEAATANMKKTTVDTLENAFSNLNNKKTEIIVLPQISALKIIHDKHYKNIKMVSDSLQDLKLYHFVNKKNKHLIPLLTPILQDMQKSGEIRYWYDSYLRSIKPKS